MNSKNGFTIIEILMVLLVASVMLAAVWGTVNLAQKSSSGIEVRVVAQKDVRGALDLMALELRMASYNQSLDNSIWLNPNNCQSASVNSSYKGIQTADQFNITVEMDINDSRIIGDVPNEIIAYSYDNVNQLITRSSNCGQPYSFIGDTVASGNPRLVLVVNNLVNVPVFRYFDYNNNEILPANLPAGIPTIRTIGITLVVDTENVDPLTNQRPRITYSTLVTPRNHGVNP